MSWMCLGLVCHDMLFQLFAASMACQFRQSFQFWWIFQFALLNFFCLCENCGAQTRTRESLSGALLFTSLPTAHPECGAPPTSLSILIKLVSSAAAPKPCGEEQIACLCVPSQPGNR